MQQALVAINNGANLTATLPVTEPALRTVLLAQSIEQAGAVSPPELDEALRHAMAAARQHGVARVEVGDVVQARAQAIVERAGARDASIAALAQPSASLRWLARVLPMGALLLGLAADRIANAHRVDLLSPSLLAVLAWNLVMYALLAWRACSHRGGSTELPLVLRRWARPRATRRGLAARVAADFHRRWFVATAAPFRQRLARVLHLCAAAWGAGIALSLLLRGLVVRYQFGWESTFLDAAQVHAITTVLFWPLTALFGLAPFSLAEITATQNFAGQGAAGGRWVWMYVGLLLLAVVLPRLALAAWARWREARLLQKLHIDLQDSAFDGLRATLPADVRVGVLGASPAQADTLRAIAAEHTERGGLQDRLRFADAQPADPTQPAQKEPVDAVIALTADAPVPPAWQAAPHAVLAWSRWAESWVVEPALFERLAPLLPERRAALERLGQAWQARNEACFDQSLQALSKHLRACAALPPGADSAARYGQHLQTLDAALRTLHGQPATPPGSPAPHMASALLPAATPRTGRIGLAVGTSAGAAAGAAAGAKAGALIDIGTGGLTMGAGTALGALLAGTTAWAVGALQQKNAADDGLRHTVEAGCTHYLVVAHQARVPPEDSAHLAARWGAEVTGTIAAHWPALAAALQPDAPQEALPPLLRTVLGGVLRRSFPAGNDS